MGVSPRDYGDARRSARFRQGLKAGDSIAGATYEAGYGSSSRIYEIALSPLSTSNWFAPGTEVDADAHVHASVIERGAEVEAGCRIEHSLILGGAQIGAGSRIRRAIVGPGVVVPEGSTIKRRMVTAARADLVPRAADSNVGGLVYSRLEGAR